MACKDKNNLPVGQAWRRVSEVNGGGWKKQGRAWTQDVFAYNLSISCNHCEDPICVKSCPTRAMHKRADGLVLIDRRLCIGCKYCAWVCPYGAPQFDANTGVMGKCDLCADYLEAGKNPSCVDACPMRALDFGGYAELAGKHGASRHVYPLPDTSITNPSIRISAHRDTDETGTTVANLEEVRLADSGLQSKDWSLVVFTLLAQLSIGLTLWWAVLTMVMPDTALVAVTGFGSPLLAALALIGIATFSSLLHLGNPRNAPRALNNLAGSWLSREILAIIAYSTGLLLTLAIGWNSEGAGVYRLSLTLAALLGLGLLWTMIRVYRVATIPAWDHWYTPVSFSLATVCLGLLLLLVYGSAGINTIADRATGTMLIPLTLILLLEFLFATIHQQRLAAMYTGIGNLAYDRGRWFRVFRFRLLLLVVSIIAAGIFALYPALPHGRGGMIYLLAIVVLVVGQEVTGRFLFYSSYFRNGL